MTVSKLTNNVKPLDEVDKINEIIDELDNIDPLPSQTGQSGKYLTTNGTVPSWAEVPTPTVDQVYNPSSVNAQSGTAVAQAVSDTIKTNAITNCITEIPQDVKLELDNGTLTLKAGSKVYVPNGFESDGVTRRFDERIIDYDIPASGWTNLRGEIFIGADLTSRFTGIDQIYSGSSGVLSGGNVWYDTDNNLIKRCDDGSTWTSGFSLPIAVVTSNNSDPNGTSGISSINQIFNGFGYIGSHAFALPGVKGLAPNGRNEDGTLKNIEITLSRVWTTDGYTAPYMINGFSGMLACYYANYAAQDTQPSFSNGEWYNTSTNEWYGIENNVPRLSPSFIVGNVVVNNSKVTSFTPKTPLHLVNYSDLTNCQVVIETYQNGTSWYRIWSDGWCEQGGKLNIAQEAASTLITLLKPYRDTVYYPIVCITDWVATWQAEPNARAIVRTNSSFSIQSGGNKNPSNMVWQACGYII